MRIILAAAVGASLFTAGLGGGGQADPIERGRLRLHYVQKPIGYERYEVVRDGDALKLSSDFDFTDRGGRVQLTATLRTRADFTPLSFKASGKSCSAMPAEAIFTTGPLEKTCEIPGNPLRFSVRGRYYTP